jgi:hypothetical protein
VSDESVHRGLVLIAAIVAACAFALSLVAGAPRALPDIALGWPLILHLERAGFFALLITGVGGIAFGLLTGGRVRSTGGGPLPSVEVAAPDVRQASDGDLDQLTRRLMDVEQRVLQLEGRGN